MKKISVLFLFAIIFILGFSKASHAQGNLQFNQVILVDLAASGTFTINVPAGKVWKIETANTFNGASNGIILRNAAVQTIAILATSATSASSNFPFWLPSGYSGSFVNGSGSGRACVSIIEFNVVP
jgi:hypothetical protein